MDKPTVFIGSSKRAEAIAKRVKEELSSVADPVLWSDSGFFGVSEGTFESLTSKRNLFDFAVLIFTPDDEVVHGDTTKQTPRPNVLIEFGLFAGTLGRRRTFIMRPPFNEPLDMPSDLDITVVAMEACKDIFTNPDEFCYDVNRACAKVIHLIQERWRRPRLEEEIVILRRLIDAMAYPRYSVTEAFDTIEEVIKFLGDLLTKYVYPKLNLIQLKTMRIYFAYYIGDGITNLQEGMEPTACLDRDSAGKEFNGEFIIGLANPTDIVSERDWRVGRAIEGFSGKNPISKCAEVFQSGRSSGFDDARMIAPGIPNYETPDELSVWSYPVEWRSEHGNFRIGVLTISSKSADSVDEKIKAMMEFLAQVVGFIFSLHGVINRKTLEKDGSVSFDLSKMRGYNEFRSTKQGVRFAQTVVGLRRSISRYFEQMRLNEKKHHLIKRNEKFYLSVGQAAEIISNQ